MLEHTQAAATNVVGSGALPGIVIAVAHGNAPPEHVVIGTDGMGMPLAEDTLFAVASVTKLLTALAVLRLDTERQLGIDDPLSKHLPDAAAAVDGVTLRHVLSHTAGLPDDVLPELAPYTPALDWPTLAAACLGTPPVRRPMERVIYSNVGSGLLAVVVGRITGTPFSDAARMLVLEPLGIEGYLGVEPPRRPAYVIGPWGDHAGTDLEPFNTPFWRRLALPWGGLLTTADGALRLVCAFSGRPAGFLPKQLLNDATTDQTSGLSGEMARLFEWPRCQWGLGVDIRGEKRPHFAPPHASPTSYGHAGISGALAWHDPEADVSWAMLGSRFFAEWFDDHATIGNAILQDVT